MIDSQQTKNIVFVYQKILDNENRDWCEIDNYLDLLQMLDDNQLYREAAVLYTYHKGKTMGCGSIHQEGHYCLVINIIDAVDSIIQLYEETSNLHPKNRYILSYYLALCQDGFIVEMGS